MDYDDFSVIKMVNCRLKWEELDLGIQTSLLLLRSYLASLNVFLFCANVHVCVILKLFGVCNFLCFISSWFGCYFILHIVTLLLTNI
jgi:hypothetical protein